MGKFFSIKICKQTGRRYVMEGVLKWGRMYYTCDAWKTQATSKSESKAAAIANGSILWMPQ